MVFGQGSGLQRQVISTLDNQGRDVMGLDTLAWKYPDNSIVSGSLLTSRSIWTACARRLPGVGTCCDAMR